MGVGLKSCVIDNLLEAPASNMAAITYTVGKGCNGEGGSARPLGSEQALFEYIEGKDGLAILELADSTVDSVECIEGIIQALAAQVTFKVILACAQTAAAVGEAAIDTITAINNILSKYNLQISDKEVEQATEPPTENKPATSLRGTVTQQSSCRYAPSEFHLYKTGFKSQAPVKIIGRDADGDWLQIELSGGNTPCWMNASLVQVEGDVMALSDMYPPDRRLPISDAFPQLTLISASPGGNGVTALWVHFEIREDLKQTDTVEYVIEVWTCMNGKPAFYAVGTNDTVATFQVDNSCGIASYAHLIGQDEHGFSFPTKIPLP